MSEVITSAQHDFIIIFFCLYLDGKYESLTDEKWDRVERRGEYETLYCQTELMTTWKAQELISIELNER